MDNLNSLRALAEKLATNNTGIKFKYESPLSAIPARDMIIRLGNDAFIDESDNAARKEAKVISKKIADVVRGEVSYYREVVAPMIEEVDERITNGAVKDLLDKPAINLTVNKIYLPDWMMSPELYAEVEKQAGTELTNVDDFIRLPDADGLDLVQMAMQVSPTLSVQINEWAYIMGKDRLAEIWNKWFVDGAVYNGAYVTRPAEIDEYAVVWAWANNLKDDPISGINAAPVRFQNFMMSVAKNVASRVKSVVDVIKRARRLEQLVVSIEDHKNTVWLDGVVADKWLANGGDMDVVYGWWVTPNRPRMLTVPLIKEKTDEFMANYRRQIELSAKDKENKISMAIADGLEASYRIFRANPPEDIKELVVRNTGKWEAIDKQVANFIASVRVRDVSKSALRKHISNVSIKLVSRFFFPHTNAGVFFYKFNEVVERNPEMDVDEASKYATVYMLCEYIANQIQTSEVTVTEQ